LSAAFFINSTAVTDEIDKSEMAAVTFLGQDNNYYVWWLK
jgi:hypothetical protein